MPKKKKKKKLNDDSTVTDTSVVEAISKFITCVQMYFNYLTIFYILAESGKKKKKKKNQIEENVTTGKVL